MLNNPLDKKQTSLQFLWLAFFGAVAVFVFAFMFWVIQ